jgi:glycosyltransferase involved in cell wall biosynthesis
MRPGPSGGIVRVYDVVRTAHLERDADRTDVRIRYARTRYDFDAELLGRVDARRQGTWSLFIELLKDPPAVIEVNEPLSFPAMSRLAAVFAATRLRRGPNPRMVSYAIENLDPRPFITTLPARARWTRRAWLQVAPSVWHRLDRVAFGTEQAADLYQEVFGSPRAPRPDVRLIPHLPAAVVHESTPPRDGVVFVGDLSDRKGFPRLLEAWPIVADAEPEVRLHLIGSGTGVAAARAFALARGNVEVRVDPPRDVIDQALRRGKVLVLPSERGRRWREQVGLPIVEGLARGCLIVTTSETGLAPWLEAHGHWVVPPGDTSALAAALIAALRSRRDVSSIIADLPEVDGRAAADRWLTDV